MPGGGRAEVVHARRHSRGLPGGAAARLALHPDAADSLGADEMDVRDAAGGAGPARPLPIPTSLAGFADIQTPECPRRCLSSMRLNQICAQKVPTDYSR